MVHEPDYAPPVTVVSLERSWGQFGISALGLTLILAACWYLAGLLIQQTNQDPGKATIPLIGKVTLDQDQKHHINQALLTRDASAADGGEMTSWSEALEKNMPYRTDGVVAPLWPWVAARLAPKEASPSGNPAASPADREFFTRGKWANVSIVMVFLWGLGLAMARSFRPAAVVTVLLLGAFGALLPGAVFFLPESLYSVFFFLSWICAVRLLIQNDLWLHLVFGLLSGLAYLAKTAVEPLLLVWFGVSAWQFLMGLFRQEAVIEEYRWTCRNHFFGIIVFAVGWMLVVSPRYSFAQEKWGDPRFSYSETWLWFDDAASGEAWTLAHPDQKSLEKIPADQMPSPLHYAKTHSNQQVTDRLVDGYWAGLSSFLTPEIITAEANQPFQGWRVLMDRRGVYLGAVAAVFLLMAVLMWSRRRAVDRGGMSLPGGSGSAAIFVVGTFFAYSLIYGWHHPVGSSDFLMLPLYLPLVFSLIWGAENFLDFALMRHAPGWVPRVYEGSLWILNAAIVWRLVEILRNPVFEPTVL